jgi:hypothetical protein
MNTIFFNLVYIVLVKNNRLIHRIQNVLSHNSRAHTYTAAVCVHLPSTTGIIPCSF